MQGKDGAEEKKMQETRMSQLKKRCKRSMEILSLEFLHRKLMQYLGITRETGELDASILAHLDEAGA